MRLFLYISSLVVRSLADVQISLRSYNIPARVSVREIEREVAGKQIEQLDVHRLYQTTGFCIPKETLLFSCVKENQIFFEERTVDDNEIVIKKRCAASRGGWLWGNVSWRNADGAPSITAQKHNGTEIGKRTIGYKVARSSRMP